MRTISFSLSYLTLQARTLLRALALFRPRALATRRISALATRRTSTLLMAMAPRRLRSLFRPRTLAFLLVCTLSAGIAKGQSAHAIWDSLLHIEDMPANLMPQQQKLQLVLSLRQQFEQAHLPEDSVYARLLHRIAVYQYKTTREFNKCIDNTLRSLRINTSGQRGSCPALAVKSYMNMGFFYKDLLFYDNSLRYFDSAILLAGRLHGMEVSILGSRQWRSNIFYIKGDFQKCIEEAILGIRLSEDIHDTVYRIILLNQKAYAEAHWDRPQQATTDADRAGLLSGLTHDAEGKANSLSRKACIFEYTGQFREALQYYQQAIRYRSSSGPSDQLAYDCIDEGNLLMEKMHNYPAAENSFQKALQLALQNGSSMAAATACNDLGILMYYRNDYARSIYYGHQALRYLKVNIGADPLKNPAFADLLPIQDKEILRHIFGNKTESLLHLYGRSGQPAHLAAALQTALLTDSLISAMRHGQISEPSKLYWRNQTREVFSNALEACWLAKDPEKAFFFMEKSRAVLLNDKLNELGASALLPPAEASKEQQFQLHIIEQQQRLNELGDSSSAYSAQQTKVLQAKEDFERYTRTLEQKAPAYYQYKYADDVPTLHALQQYLATNNQYFVHYYINDSIIYILGISARDARLLRIPYKNFNTVLTGFLALCSDLQMQNADYRNFAARAYGIYQTLFQPLQWQHGRVVICPDNFFIPFEALTSDTAGKHFLLFDYTFDYIYSARFLMKPFSNPEGKGNFLGIAPAVFAAYLHVPELGQSIDASSKAASFYRNTELLTNKDACRRAFLDNAPAYTIVNVYSHASAGQGLPPSHGAKPSDPTPDRTEPAPDPAKPDLTKPSLAAPDQSQPRPTPSLAPPDLAEPDRTASDPGEPLLFMSDSVIHLSELQLLQHPSTQLIVLSACQTNAGKNAMGEGVYSLARGFAAAGIPAVAATLWEADEQSIYTITDSFHEGLARGMTKDLALQQSKMAFLRNGSSAMALPYYWANLIVIGNAQPITLMKPAAFPWLPLAGFAVLLILVGLLIGRVVFRNRRSRPGAG